MQNEPSRFNPLLKLDQFTSGSPLKLSFEIFRNLPSTHIDLDVTGNKNKYVLKYLN